MPEAITQKKAKVLIRDYLRETGRRGVTSLLKDIRRHIGRPIFEKRTIEKWLREQERTLQEGNWQDILSFIQSDNFRKHVPYANKGPDNDRLRKVAAGLIALYTEDFKDKTQRSLPSAVEAAGVEAVKLLDGFWATDPDALRHRLLLRVVTVPGTRYAKFVIFTPLSRLWLPATGLVIYVSSDDVQGYNYTHTFVIQAWLRRNPEAGQNSRATLTYLTLARNQPEFCLLTGEKPLLLSHTAALVSGAEPDNDRTPPKYRKHARPMRKNEVLLRATSPSDETVMVIDQLIEDVLPHGYV